MAPSRMFSELPEYLPLVSLGLVCLQICPIWYTFLPILSLYKKKVLLFFHVFYVILSIIFFDAVFSSGLPTLVYACRRYDLVLWDSSGCTNFFI
jgi:uncharacterized membrane protein